MDHPTNDPDVVIGRLNRQLAALSRENTKLKDTASEANDLKDRAQAAEAENRTLRQDLHKGKKAKNTASAEQKEWLDERAKNLKLAGENARMSKEVQGLNAQMKDAFEKAHPELEGEEDVGNSIREEIQGLTEQLVLAKQQLRILEDDSNDLLEGVELNTESLTRIARAAVNSITDATKLLQPLLDAVPLDADDPGLPNSPATTVGDFLQLQTLLSNFGRVFRRLQAHGNIAPDSPARPSIVTHISPHAEKMYEKTSQEELISKLVTALNQREVAVNNENKALEEMAVLRAERDQAFNDLILNRVEQDDNDDRIKGMQKLLDESCTRSQSFSKEIKRLQDLLDAGGASKSSSKTSNAPQHANADEPLTQTEMKRLLNEIEDALAINAEIRKRVGRLDLKVGLIQQQNPNDEEAESLRTEITELNFQIAAKDRDITKNIQRMQERQEDVRSNRLELSQVEKMVQKALGQDKYNEQDVIGGLKRLARDAKSFRGNNALKFTFSRIVRKLRQFMEIETARPQTPGISDVELRRRQGRETLFQELEEEATKLIDGWRTEEQGGRNNDDLSRVERVDDDEDGSADDDEGEESEDVLDNIDNLDELKDLYGKMKNAALKLTNKCQEEKAELQNQLENAKVDYDNEKKDLRNQIEELQTARATLQNQIDDMTPAGEEMQQLIDSISDEDHDDPFSEQDDDDSEETKREIRRLRTKALQDKLDCQKAKADLYRQIRELINKNVVLRTRLQRFIEDTELWDDTAVNDGDSAFRDQARATMQSLRNKIHELQTDLEKAEEHCAAEKRKLERKCHDRIQALRDRGKLPPAGVDDAEPNHVPRREHDRVLDELRAQSAEAQRYRDEREQRWERLIAVNSAFEQYQANTMQKMTALICMNNGLRRELAKYDRSPDPDDRNRAARRGSPRGPSEARRRNRELQNHIGFLNRTIEDLHAAMEVLRQQQGSGDGTMSQADYDALRSQYNQMVDAAAQETTDELRRQLRELQQERDLLQTRQRRAEAAHENLQDYINSLQEKLDKCEKHRREAAQQQPLPEGSDTPDSLAPNRDDPDGDEIGSAELDQRVVDLQAEIDSLRERLDECEQYRKQTSQDVDEIDRLRRQMNDKNKRINELQERVHEREAVQNEVLDEDENENNWLREQVNLQEDLIRDLERQLKECLARHPRPEEVEAEEKDDDDETPPDSGGGGDSPDEGTPRRPWLRSGTVKRGGPDSGRGSREGRGGQGRGGRGSRGGRRGRRTQDNEEEDDINRSYLEVLRQKIPAYDARSQDLTMQLAKGQQTQADTDAQPRRLQGKVAAPPAPPAVTPAKRRQPATPQRPVQRRPPKRKRISEGDRLLEDSKDFRMRERRDGGHGWADNIAPPGPPHY